MEGRCREAHASHIFNEEVLAIGVAPSLHQLHLLGLPRIHGTAPHEAQVHTEAPAVYQRSCSTAQFISAGSEAKHKDHKLVLCAGETRNVDSDRSIESTNKAETIGKYSKLDANMYRAKKGQTCKWKRMLCVVLPVHA